MREIRTRPFPEMVNHLTPNGAVQDDFVQQGVSLPKGQLLG